jgi:hypothetical protein
VDLQTASLTNSIEPSLEPPITFSNRTHKGRKRKVIVIDFTANKIQQGLKGIASILYKQSILVLISENINSLILKKHSKEIRNNGWDRHK